MMNQLCKLLLFLESSLQGLHDVFNVDTCHRMNELHTSQIAVFEWQVLLVYLLFRSSYLLLCLYFFVFT